MVGAQRLRDQIASGRPALGTFLAELNTAGVPQILSNGGLDFVIIDGEHGTHCVEQIRVLIISAHAAGITALVRVVLGDRGAVTKVLDAGADGIVFPQVQSMDDVHLAVEHSKYPPLGRRGVHLLRPHTRFNPPAERFKYMDECNRTLITAIQLETTAAGEIAEEIIATEGVDMIYVGPADLAANLGDCDSPEDKIRQIQTRAARACRQHGKIAGSHCTLEDIEWLRGEGFAVFGYAAATKLLIEGAERFTRRAHDALGGAPDLA